MATVLGLAMKVTADASGLPASLTPVDKALADLGSKAESTAAIFDRFRATTEGAANAQANVKSQFEQLAAALAAGEITANQYAAAFTSVQTSAQETARVFADGAATIEKYKTEQQQTAEQVARLNEQFKVGAIDQGTYERAIADVTGATAAAAKEEENRNQFLDRAAQLTRQALGPIADYDREVTELNEHLRAGTITQETYDTLLGQAADKFNKAEAAANGYGKASEDAGKGSALQFNELSGILAAIPGPIGNIAGRLSGLSSAAEGLGRVFAGGLQGGISAIATSVASLANPFTLAVAGIAAFGAGAAAVASGLASLSGRVEELANTASRLGTSFEFVQVLEEAAKRTGLSIDEIASALQKFEVNIAKAREGGNDAAQAFEKLGISQEQLRNTDPSELAIQTAEALSQIEDPAERAALATETLGKKGLELLPAFASLDDSQAALERFSATISAVDVERLAGVDDSFDDIRTALQGLSQNLLTPFAGLADGVASAIADAIGGFTNLLEPILDRITPFLDAIGEGFTAVGEVIYDAATFAGDTLETLFSVIERLGTIVGAAVGSTLGYVADLVSGWVEFTGLGTVISSVTSAISAAFNGLWNGIKNVVGQVGGFIEQVLQFAEDWLGIERGVEKTNESYEKQAEVVKQVAEEADKKAKAEQEAAQKVIDANKRIADSLLEQLEIDEQFGGDSARFKAAKNVEAIEQEIARVREEVEKARAAGDTEAERAGMQRLAQLDQIQAQQEDIASGAAAARKAAEEEQKRIDADRKKRDEERQKLLESNAKDIAKAEEKYSEEWFELEKERISELNELRLGAIDIADIRTAEGAAAFLDLASGRTDPAIEEYRKQRKELEGLRKDITKLIGQRAEILGGAA
jgi:chromosome segregation ATPase